MPHLKFEVKLDVPQGDIQESIDSIIVALQRLQVGQIKLLKSLENSRGDSTILIGNIAVCIYPLVVK